MPVPVSAEDVLVKQEDDAEEIEDDDLEGVIGPSGGPVKRVAASAHLSAAETPANKRAAKARLQKAKLEAKLVKEGKVVKEEPRETSPGGSTKSKMSKDSKLKDRASKDGKRGQSGVESEDILNPEENGEQLDTELQKVQNKLGSPFQVCLLSLDPKRTLAGEKLGVARASVPPTLCHIVTLLHVASPKPLSPLALAALALAVAKAATAAIACHSSRSSIAAVARAEP